MVPGADVSVTLVRCRHAVCCSAALTIQWVASLQLQGMQPLQHRLGESCVTVLWQWQLAELPHAGTQDSAHIFVVQCSVCFGSRSSTVGSLLKPYLAYIS